MIFEVHPSTGLYGEVRPGGYKHSVLPIIAASLLSDEPVELRGVPETSDVDVLCKTIRHLGGSAERRGGSLHLCAAGVTGWEVPAEFAGQLRGIYLFMPSLLIRCGRFAVPTPGGDQIGDRTLEFGLHILREMGATTENGPVMSGERQGRLRGTVIRNWDHNDLPSITKIGLIAGSVAEGITVIHNPFRSPEIIDLANFLIALGADISGMGSDTVVIVGSERLRGGSHEVLRDPIEASTFLAACAMVGGEVTATGVRADTLPADLAILRGAGVEVIEGSDFVTVRAVAGQLKAVDFASTPRFPDLNTDAAPHFVGMAGMCAGCSSYEEGVWEGRWGYIGELNKMGAKMRVDGKRLIMEGIPRYRAAEVLAGDLRAASTLILAGLAAEGGVTRVHDAHLAYRGYEFYDEKLRRLGAKIDVIA